jgi:hypothetical protein
MVAVMVIYICDHEVLKADSVLLSSCSIKAREKNSDSTNFKETNPRED